MGKYTDIANGRYVDRDKLTDLDARIEQHQQIIRELIMCHEAESGRKWNGKIVGASEEPEREVISPVNIGDMVAMYDKLRDPVIHGLARRGETVNIIADAKKGKSWLAYGLALSIAIGAKWLDRFQCERGRVLIIDNELHSETAAFRIPTVATAMELELDDYRVNLDVITLRGKLVDLTQLGPLVLDHLEHQYNAIFLDAFYRFLRDNENGNDTQRDAYNLIDQYAMETDAVFLPIHHSSKGDQSNKRVTDVGAGGGAQSRAADSHVILREHQEDGAVVLEAAVRSFAPVDPLPLRFTFPVWEAAEDLDADDLKGKQSPSEERQAKKDEEGRETILDVLRNGQETRRQLRTKTGMGFDRLNRLVRQLIERGEAEEITIGDQEVIQITNPVCDF